MVHQSLLFFFNDTATPEIYTLSLHDALPISRRMRELLGRLFQVDFLKGLAVTFRRSEEHTSELQSQSNIVCRLLLEKKKECRPSALSPAPTFRPIATTTSWFLSTPLPCTPTS